MPNKTSLAKAKCPFFKSDSSTTIACESILQNCRRIRSEFVSSHCKILHEEKYCFGFGYHRCPIAEVINDKLNREEERV